MESGRLQGRLVLNVPWSAVVREPTGELQEVVNVSVKVSYSCWKGLQRGIKANKRSTSPRADVKGF